VQAPSDDLTVHLFEPLRTECLLVHDRARWADDGWSSLKTTLFDDDGTLIAYGAPPGQVLDLRLMMSRIPSWL
jgi:hypothetical protein